MARAIHSEVKAGRGSPHGGVFLDIHSRRSAEDIKRKLPAMYHQFKELGDVDITKESMEVGPTGHYTMGGIRVDPETQESRIKGLFAAGECAAGMHGANRLGGNSLSDLLAARYAKAQVDPPALDKGEIEAATREALAPFERAEGPNPFLLHEDLKDKMQTFVGIIRTEDDLKKGIEHVERLKEESSRVKVEDNRHFNSAWHQAVDMRNMLIVSEAMARAALARKESRGGHARDDFPDMDKGHFAKVNITLRAAGAGMEVTEAPHADPPPEIQTILDEKE